MIEEVVEESPVDLKEPLYYINRELSMLEFQRRVLEEAQDEHNPLLERAKFLAILGSNLDEFFMVRVSGLKKQIDAGVVDLPPDGLTPAQQLAEIRKVAQQLMIQARECLHNDLMPRLRNAGIHILSYQELNERQKAMVNNYFEEVVFPVLTPLAFDPGHPFPHISNLSLNLAVVIRDQDGRELFARVKVPDSLPRLVPLKKSSGSTRKDGTSPAHHYFVYLEQAIAENLNKLFPGMEIIEAHPFRVTRDADMIIQEMEAADLLETMEISVRQRRFGNVVRVTVEEGMPTRIREILIENLEMDRRDIYTMDAPLGLSDLMSLHSIDRYDQKDPTLKPALPQPLRGELQDGNLLAAIRREDILLHHPYNSFKPVVDFLRLAARDPDVLAIKQTLYRVGRNSPVVQALLEARENGKQVAVLVELKARFDEESNIGWARTLEKEGVHVIYGLLGLKTHSKIALVVRKEGDAIRRYVHLATGNYNAITAQIYEDIGMFTCDEEIGADSTDLFNYLTGYSAKKVYRKLLVAPINLRQGMVALIDREIDHHRRNGNGHLIFKMNSLVDPPMIRKLYRASQAGVKIDLIVRGMCSVRPGVAGFSETISVRSVVGRFLEHSRIFVFGAGDRERFFIGSADIMERNLDRRVEAVTPVDDPESQARLRQIIAVMLADNRRAWQLEPDDRWRRVEESAGDAPRVDTFETMMESARASSPPGA